MTAEDLLERLDKDGDGDLSLRELKKRPDLLRLDPNYDGVLTGAELGRLEPGRRRWGRGPGGRFHPALGLERRRRGRRGGNARIRADRRGRAALIGPTDSWLHE